MSIYSECSVCNKVVENTFGVKVSENQFICNSEDCNIKLNYKDNKACQNDISEEKSEESMFILEKNSDNENEYDPISDLNL